MKSPFTLVLFLVLFSNTLFAQYYEFEVVSEPYVAITTGDYIDTDLTSENFTFATDANYSVYGNDPSVTYTLGRNGFLVSSGVLYSYSYDPFLADLRKRDAQSSIIATESWDGTDSILTIQWNNMGLLNHPTTDFVNVQLRIHRFKKLIEFHYGPSNVTATGGFGGLNGPVVNTIWFSLDFSVGYEYNWITGDPNDPTLSSANSAWPIDGVPAENTIYRFFVEDTTTSIAPLTAAQEASWSLFPNPATDRISWDTGEHECVAGEIFGIMGRKIQTLSPTELTKLSVSTEAFAPGTYLLRLTTKEGQLLQRKFVVD